MKFTFLPLLILMTFLLGENFMLADKLIIETSRVLLQLLNIIAYFDLLILLHIISVIFNAMTSIRCFLRRPDISKTITGKN